MGGMTVRVRGGITMQPQEGLFHSPGAFSGVVTLRLSRNAALPYLREAVSAIHAELASAQGVHAVIGLQPMLVPDAPPEGPPVLPREGATLRFPSTQVQVLVQVSADSRARLLWALRRIRALSAAVLVLEEEVLGGQIGEGREPFGFRDGLLKPSREQIRHTALVSTQPLAGASWLLYVRFQQDLSLFSHLSRPAQERVVGRTHDGELLADPPAEAHVLRARLHGGGEMPTFIRRGFPFRQSGEEGLAFIAASADPEHYRRSLDALLGTGEGPADAMLRYATPVAGGLYLAPPRGWFLTQSVPETGT